MDLFISTFLKFFFIMTPFFVMSVFLTMTKDANEKEKKSLAIKVTISIIIISLILLFFGKHIFSLFGITLDAFRIGAGALLFLTAVELVRGNTDNSKTQNLNISEIAVVPLSIPITIGPGTIGILLVMGADFKTTSDLIIGSIALVLSIICVGFMLTLSNMIEKVVGKQGIIVISKVTGIFVAAISAQIMFTGIKDFLGI